MTCSCGWGVKIRTKNSRSSNEILILIFIIQAKSQLWSTPWYSWNISKVDVKHQSINQSINFDHPYSSRILTLTNPSWFSGKGDGGGGSLYGCERYCTYYINTMTYIWCLKNEIFFADFFCGNLVFCLACTMWLHIHPVEWFKELMEVSTQEQKLFYFFVQFITGFDELMKSCSVWHFLS